MKTTLFSSCILAVSLTAFAQGKVTFSNDSTRLFVLGTTLAADAGLGGGTPTVGDTTGAIPISPLPSGVTLTATLYAGTSSSSLSLQTTVSLTGSDWLIAGRMAGKAVTLSGVPGGTAQNFLIVFTDLAATRPSVIPGNATQPANFFDAIYYGSSSLFTAVPGTSVTYPFLIQTASGKFDLDSRQYCDQCCARAIGISAGQFGCAAVIPESEDKLVFIQEIS